MNFAFFLVFFFSVYLSLLQCALNELVAIWRLNSISYILANCEFAHFYIYFRKSEEEKKNLLSQ